MSSSQHPVALSLEQRVGGATRLLATVMMLPLLDGVFAAIVLTDVLTSVTGILSVGLLIFGGSATLAVILAELDDDPASIASSVLVVGAGVIIGAVVVAALAPTIERLVDMAVFERFAALIILTIAARTASARVAEWLPRPAMILGLGLVASLRLDGAALVVRIEPGLMLRAAAAAGVGVVFALSVALAGPWLRNAVDIDRFRFGCAVALGVLSLSFFGIIPGNTPVALAVLGVTTVFALNPGHARRRDDNDPDSSDVIAASTDGGNSEAIEVEDVDIVSENSVDSASEDTSDGERLPWL